MIGIFTKKTYFLKALLIVEKKKTFVVNIQPSHLLTQLNTYLLFTVVKCNEGF